MSLIAADKSRLAALLSQCQSAGFARGELTLVRANGFATGYSSLAYLRYLPLNQLKINRSFVRGTPHAAATVPSILAMVEDLGLRMVADDVETSVQASFLNAAGCYVLQVYLVAQPMPLASWPKQLQTTA